MYILLKGDISSYSFVNISAQYYLKKLKTNTYIIDLNQISTSTLWTRSIILVTASYERMAHKNAQISIIYIYTRVGI